MQEQIFIGADNKMRKQTKVKLLFVYISLHVYLKLLFSLGYYKIEN